MRHQDFRQHVRDAAVGEALDTIEANILPSLTLMIDSAVSAQPGTNALLRADELREIAAQLEALTKLLEAGARRSQPSEDPFSTDA